MSPRLGRGRRWLLVVDRRGRHNHRPRTPDHVAHKRPGELPLEVQGELGEANERVVAVFLQRPTCGGCSSPPPVLVSDDGGVGDGRGT